MVWSASGMPPLNHLIVDAGVGSFNPYRGEPTAEPVALDCVNDERLLAIDTPERGQPGYLEATHELAELLNPTGRLQPLIVHTIRRDGFGRWLATVWVEGSDTSINDQMIQRGHARR